LSLLVLGVPPLPSLLFLEAVQASDLHLLSLLALV
jgi:hypothetical protein